jgi:hypothetical protein
MRTENGTTPSSTLSSHSSGLRRIRRLYESDRGYLWQGEGRNRSFSFLPPSCPLIVVAVLANAAAVSYDLASWSIGRSFGCYLQYQGRGSYAGECAEMDDREDERTRAEV